MTTSTPLPLSPIKGILLVLASLLMWGFFPIWLVALKSVAPFEILAHRIVWSCLFLLLLLLLSASTQRRQLRLALQQRRVLQTLLASALLIGANWLIFTVAVVNQQIMAASLGYFIGPACNILLGVLFLKERLNSWQRVTFALIVLSIAVQIATTPQALFISLGLALTFSLYGFLRKQVAVNSQVGLTIETLILLPPALLFLAITPAQSFGPQHLTLSLLLAGFGTLTAVPLLLFVSGTRALPLTTVGLLQYVSPSIQFLIALWIYHEPMTTPKIFSYGLIWCALGIAMIPSRS